MGRMDFLDVMTGGNGSVPIFLRDMTLGMDVRGVRTSDVIDYSGFDPELSADCICSFAELTGQDAVIGCCHSPAFIIEQFGGEMKYPEYGIPAPMTHPLENITDLSGYDTEPRGKALQALESYSIVRQRMRDRAVVANVTGPLTKAGVIAGIEWISMLMESDRGVLESLLALCLEHTERIVESMDCDASIDAGLLASATDNPDLFGRDRFAEFSIPWTREFCRMFLKRGYPVIWHPHGRMFGESEDMSDLLMETGCSCFHYAEDNDLRKIHEKVRIPVMGGTDIVPTLMGSDKERIVSETEEHLSTFRDRSFIFSASCSLHRGVPLDNIRTMTKTVRRFS